ncbi:MAG: pilus assembly protein [Nocardioidaceae bacterium]|nr:MAG: pilus assembly protein [Nocardioidaceae bacterium]
MCEKVRRGVRRRTPRAIRHRDDSRGAVTVEAAAVIPVLVAIAIALAWLISLVLTQIRLVDAAREVARAAARAESLAEAKSLGVQVAPAGSDIEIVVEAHTVRALVRADVQGPGGLLSFLPIPRLEAEAVAMLEPSGD